MSKPETPAHADAPGRGERDERGATAVEYGLMVAMIAIVIVGAAKLFGTSVVGLYSIPAGIFVR